MSKILRSLVGYLRNIDEIYLLLKLRLDVRYAEKQVPNEPHLAFCFTMLRKFSRKYAFVIQQLPTHLRNAVCVFYLVLRALDTVEDDMTIPMEDKIPILMNFHHHIDDPNWHFSCGTGDFKVLMNQFHHVSTAFLELKKRYQEEIEDTTKRTGAAMAKFLFKEVETIDDYEEYCNHMAGFLVVALSKLFHASGLENSAADDRLSKSVGLFLQKTNITRDYLEDINATPKSRKLWPRQIWSKYVSKLEDLRYGENSVKAVQCLNHMVTDALAHAEDCLKCISTLQHPTIIRFYAVPTIIAMGTLAMCYNNIEVFGGEVKMRRGLSAKVIDRTREMPDVYGAFFDFSCILKSKVDMSDPNATKTLKRLEMIQKCCKESGLLSKRTWHIIKSKPKYNPPLVVLLLLIVFSFILAQIFAHKPRN